jgi:hypothetical protein
MFNSKKYSDELSRKTVVQSLAGLTLGVQAASMPSFAAASNASSGRKKMVRIFLNGGMSHMDSFDPKPKQVDMMGNTTVIKTNTGEEISAYFPESAKRMDRLALVRSMVSPEGDHRRAMYLNQTSYKMIGTIKHPNFGAWMQKQHGVINEDLPGSVNINDSFGAGFLGTSYDPFSVSQPKDALKGLMMDNPTSEESIELLRLMADVRRDFHKSNPVPGADDYRRYYNDSIKLMQSKDLAAFDLSKESDTMKKKFDIPYGDQFLLARRLLEADIQYISVGIGGWDHHLNLWDDNVFPMQASNFDKAFNVFLDDLEERGLLKDTIVAVSTDFGRTPVIDQDRKGRNHHRKAFFSLLAGAGVKTGTVYGKTDERAEKVVENPVDPINFNATLAKLAGLDLKREIYSPDNRPFTVARGGAVIPGLFA